MVNNIKEEIAYFAGGCFWGIEHYMQKHEGVISAVSGYMGGNIENPTYEQVKSKTSGHAEVVKISYDANIVNYETLARLFFEIHDPTQEDGQGYDLGPQYRSEIFYINEEQKDIANKLIEILKSMSYNIVTNVTPATIFYQAEDYHQDYYEIKGTQPDCHFYTRRFPHCK